MKKEGKSWGGSRKKLWHSQISETSALEKTLNKVKKLQITTTTNYETLKGRKKQHS